MEVIWYDIEQQMPPFNERVMFIMAHPLSGTKQILFYYIAIGSFNSDGCNIPNKIAYPSSKPDIIKYWTHLPKLPEFLNKETKNDE